MSDHKGLDNNIQDKEITLKGKKNRNNRNEYIISQLLLCLESFHKSIRDLQSELRNKSKGSLNEEEKRRLDYGIDIVLKGFNLTPNWRQSIEGAVFTNVLRVPESLDPIQFHLPKKYSDLKTENDYREALIEMVYPQNYREMSTYPAIIFKYRVSVREVVDWMLNSRSFQQALSRLPKRPKTRLTMRTIILGQLTAIKMQEGKNSFSEIRDVIDKEINGNEKLLAISDKIFGTPSEDDLRNAYKALMKSISTLFP